MNNVFTYSQGMHDSWQSNIPRPVILGLAALGVASLAVMAIYNCLNIQPEDVLILFQYSRNLAETGIISYIPHGLHAEGATDFLWMLYISLGMKLHISPGLATAFGNVACLGGIALILLRIAKQKIRWIPALAIVGVLSVFPQMQAALKGFTVFPFGFAIALAFLFVLESSDIGASCAALFLCLLRPDGVVFAIPLLLILLFSARKKVRTAVSILCLYVVPGACYFLWRWHYFQEMLPLPFLVKSNAVRFFHLFIPGSVKSLAPYIAFAVLAALVLFYKRRLTLRESLLLSAVLIIPFLFYSNILLLQNLDGRFFVFVPIGVALMTALEWNVPWSVPKPVALGLATGLYLILFLLPAAQGFLSNIYGIGEFRRQTAFASDLSTISPRGTMLVSEAGLMPYFSRWNPYDAFGLDTAMFARKLIQPEQVAALRPDLTIIHGVPCPKTLEFVPARTDRQWVNMSTNMFSGLALSGQPYEIWRWPTWSAKKEARLIARGEGQDDECWVISKNYAGHDQLIAVMRRHGATEITPTTP